MCFYEKNKIKICKMKYKFRKLNVNNDNNMHLNA